MQDELQKDKINAIMNDIEENIDYVKTLSDDIVNKYTKTLDEVMTDITNDVINQNQVSDDTLERYFLDLTNALYFIGSKSEFLGVYEDLSKSNARLRYNNAYSESQVNATLNGKKTTVDENRAYAENNSINETIVNSIYSRSFRIIKSKIDGANEMVKTLSKIISKRMNERDYSDYANPFDDKGDN